MDSSFLRSTRLLFSLSLIIQFLFWGSAGAMLSNRSESSPLPPTLLSLSQIWHDQNNVELLITNVGPIGQDLISSTGAGFWPIGSGNSYIYGNGLWIGGIADVDADGNPDTVVVIGYDPSQGQTEYREGRVGQSSSDPLTRVFDSRDSLDLSEWPAEFSDPQGDPNVLSDQDLVTIYNDIGGEPLGAERLGIQVNQRSMAFSGKAAGTSVHAIYFIWTVVNMSDSLPNGPFTIEDAYLGFLADVDVGRDAADDKTSFIPTYVVDGDTTLLNTAVAWDNNFFEVGFAGEVGLLGFTFDESVIAGADVNFSFMTNPSNTQPRQDPDPADDREQYDILACLNGECEEHDIATDIRFILTIGPVDIAPGESQKYRGVMFLTDPFAHPNGLEWSEDPLRVDPNQEAMANFMQVALEMKQGLTSGAFPSPFTIFRTSIHEDAADTIGPYTIYTGITDSIGLKEIRLIYSTDEGVTRDTLAMNGSGFLNFSGDIPGQPDGTTVEYYIEAVDSADVSLVDPPGAPEDSLFSFDVTTPSGIDKDDPAGSGMPRTFSLNQNYPNPFNPMTVITFDIPETGAGKQHTTLSIFDTRGRLIRSLFDGDLDPGTHHITWDGKDASGSKAGSGIYIYRLSTENGTISRKMVLLK